MTDAAACTPPEPNCATASGDRPLRRVRWLVVLGALRGPRPAKLQRSRLRGSFRYVRYPHNYCLSNSAEYTSPILRKGNHNFLLFGRFVLQQTKDSSGRLIDLARIFSDKFPDTTVDRFRMKVWIRCLDCCEQFRPMHTLWMLFEQLKHFCVYTSCNRGCLHTSIFISFFHQSRLSPADPSALSAVENLGSPPLQTGRIAMRPTSAVSRGYEPRAQIRGCEPRARSAGRD